MATVGQFHKQSGTYFVSTYGDRVGGGAAREFRNFGFEFLRLNELDKLKFYIYWKYKISKNFGIERNFHSIFRANSVPMPLHALSVNNMISIKIHKSYTCNATCSHYSNPDKINVGL